MYKLLVYQLKYDFLQIYLVFSSKLNLLEAKHLTFKSQLVSLKCFHYLVEKFSFDLVQFS